MSTLVAGLGLIGIGAWARADVRRALARERIMSTGTSIPPNAPVTSGPAARSPGEGIGEDTLFAAGGPTYDETPARVRAERTTTDGRSLAAVGAVTGEALESPHHALWRQSTALQTALVQAYLPQRLAELTVGLGAVFVGIGAGLAAASRR